MSIQKPLLVVYLLFLIGSFSFLIYSNSLVRSTQFAPGSFDRMREAALKTTDISAARENIDRYVTFMEMSERMAAERARMHSIYVWFAIIMSLPLAAYAGQSMRDKLFVTRPANMPHWVYWTLWGVSTRATALRYMKLSILFAVVSLGLAYFNPMGFLGLFALVTAGLYRYAVKWVDENSYWANATRPPFPTS
jgi:hypothetical protein